MCRAVHASACADDLPMRSLAAQFTAARRRELIIFLFWPDEDIHSPSISDLSSQLRRVREMNSPSAARAMAGSQSFVDPHGVSVHDRRKIEKGYISLESSMRAPQQHHTTH